jgi:glycosyltransferase involved in cell wall biosynthesis
MKIGIDARLYGLEHTGLGRYVMELINQLNRLDPKNQYALFLRKKHFKSLKLAKNFTKVLADIRHYSFAEQWKLPRLVHQANINLFHVPHFNVPLLYHRPFIVTIHDLLWHDVTGYNVTTLTPPVYTIKYIGYKKVVNHALKKSQTIIVPSRWVKKTLIKKFNLPSQKIRVVYEGIGRTFLQKPSPSWTKKLLKKISLSPPFLIYTGNLYPHKNLTVLLQALNLLKNKQPQLKLVIVGARSVMLPRIKKEVFDRHLTTKVIFAHNLSDKDLASLYSQAEALVHPSISEGFGLTGVEAMAVGLPVIASTATSLPEIYGRAALYFKPTDPHQLAEKILKVLKNKSFRHQLISAGKKQVENYSWQKMTQETLQLYEKTNKNR